jgi:ferredoxin
MTFEEIKSLFDDKEWDVGYLSAEQLKRVAHQPVKTIFNPNGESFVNGIHFNNLTNAIVLVKKGSTWDYRLYQQADEILFDANLSNPWNPIYTNFKHAAVVSGVGVQARNSLIYTYKFGFDAHIMAYQFHEEITDIPTNFRENHGLWHHCYGCMDCVNACPVKAIHADDNQKEPFWLESDLCDNFIGYGDHDRIPTLKSFWETHVYPEMKGKVNHIKTYQDAVDEFGENLPFDNNGYKWDGNVTWKDGRPVALPVCRECTSQPRCSKWGGKYPYEKIQNVYLDELDEDKLAEEK